MRAHRRGAVLWAPSVPLRALRRRCSAIFMHDDDGVWNLLSLVDGPQHLVTRQADPHARGHAVQVKCSLLAFKAAHFLIVVLSCTTRLRCHAANDASASHISSLKSRILLGHPAEGQVSLAQCLTRSHVRQNRNDLPGYHCH